MTPAFSMTIHRVKFCHFTGGSDGVTIARVTALGIRLGDLHAAAALAALALWFRAKFLATALGHTARGNKTGSS